MNLCSLTVAGSRHPVLVPVLAREPSSSSSASEPEAPQPAPPPPIPSSSRIRRKPTRTYKSISAHDSVGLSVEGTPSTQRLKPFSLNKPGGFSKDSQYPNSTTSINGIHQDIAIQKPDETEPYTSSPRSTGPPLPLYHPQGIFALSLPELDPSEFGLPNPINIDDNDGGLQDNDLSRRASSRTRRPAAKLRDRDRDAADEELLNGVALATAKAGDPQARSASPRKRRTGGGAGGKRRRKEAEEVDGTYPQPPKRTRNPRAVVAGATASPLAGPTVAADDPELDTPAMPDVQDVDEARSELLDVPELKPSTRSRRNVPRLKRRGSSASDTTTTSISISIAANARKPRLPLVPGPEEEKDPDVNMSPAPPSKEPDEEPPAASPKEVERQEKPMDISPPPARASPPDVSMEIEQAKEPVAAPKDTVEENSAKSAVAESSTAAEDVGDPKPADIPTAPGGNDEPHIVVNKPEADGVSKPIDSAKDVPTVAFPTPAPVDTKPVSPPPEPRPAPPEPKAIPPPSHPVVKAPAAKPPQTSRVEEKEEGELSEDG